MVLWLLILGVEYCKSGKEVFIKWDKGWWLRSYICCDEKMMSEIGMKSESSR